MYPLIVFVAALAFFLPFNAYLSITDPVEANYALTAKEMLLSGNWLSPQIYGHYWYDKPAMIYWLIAASFKVLGVNEFAARLPAAVSSSASVGYIYWFGRKVFKSHSVGLLAAVVLATSLEFWVLSRMIITDAVLFLFGSVALGSLYLGLKGEGKGWYAAAYGFAALAVLTKGPIGILLPGLIVFIYIIVTRRWTLLGQVFNLPGLAVFFLVAAPWYAAMYQQHGMGFIDTFLGLHNFVRATVSEHPKDNVFYYYLVLFPVSLIPWTGIFCRALVNTKIPHFSFLTVWLAVIVGFFTLVATKYPTYAFPASFPAALLIAGELDKMKTAPRRDWLWLTLPLLVLLALAVFGTKWLPGADWVVLYLAAAASAGLICGLSLQRSYSFLLPWVAGAVVAAVSLIVIYEGMIPLAESRSAKAVALALPPQGATVAAYGKYPTSAGFYSGYLIDKLVENEQDLVPEGPWAGKYTMPTETVAAFDSRTRLNPNTYILVGEGCEVPLDGFRPVADEGSFTLYKRD